MAGHAFINGLAIAMPQPSLCANAKVRFFTFSEGAIAALAQSSFIGELPAITARRLAQDGR